MTDNTNVYKTKSVTGDEIEIGLHDIICFSADDALFDLPEHCKQRGCTESPDEIIRFFGASGYLPLCEDHFHETVHIREEDVIVDEAFTNMVTR